MGRLIKKFSNYSEYEAAQNSFILPNVSLCEEENEVYYNPSTPETRVVAKLNVTDISNPTRIGNNQHISGFSAIEIDGVEQPSVVSAYTFSTTGEHTVKYTLTDPTTIGQYAFYDCSGLTSIIIPNSVTSIGGGAFQSCSGLTSIVLPNGLTSIGNSAFFNCLGLTNVVIPDSVTSIGNNAFAKCISLTSCTIGSGVTSIESSAFANCTRLTSIVIPNGVTSIGISVFSYCSGLTSITSNAMTAPAIQSSTFKNVNTDGTLTVPSGSSGYDTWMQNADYYLGLYNWTKVEQ